jgi:hypothetical protein
LDENGIEDMTKVKKNNNHAENCKDLPGEYFDVLCFKEKVKNNVTNQPLIPLQQIFEMVRSESKEYTNTVMPDYHELSSQMKRLRNKGGSKNAASLGDIVIENKMTSNNEPFMIFDNKKKNRIVLFCSPTGLKILSESLTWHSDGTFHTKLHIRILHPSEDGSRNFIALL